MTQKVGHMTELYREHQFFSETSILLFGSAAKIFFFLEFYQVETSAVRTQEHFTLKLTEQKLFQNKQCAPGETKSV